MEIVIENSVKPAMSNMTSVQIKKKVGKAWAILGNPVYKKGILDSAELLYYNCDKTKVLEQLSKCKNGHFAMFYFGTIDTKQIYIL